MRAILRSIRGAGSGPIFAWAVGVTFTLPFGQHEDAAHEVPERPGGFNALRRRRRTAPLLVAALFGCAAGPAPREPDFEPAAGRVEERRTPDSTATYVAKLLPLNEEVAKFSATGMASFVVEPGVVDVSVSVEGLPPLSVHPLVMQGFETGHDTVCPVVDADINGDGVVDGGELEVYAGRVVLPLTRGLAAKSAEDADAAWASGAGRVEFSAQAPREELERVLGMRSASGIELDQYTVVVYGVHHEAELPASVKPLDSASPHMSVPVACGVLERKQ
jgi:hypothetical protein